MIKKTIEAKVVPATLETIRKYSGKIYVDETNLQRLIDKWSDQIASDHMTACLKGHSNIYTIVLISINGVINYCEQLIQSYDEGSAQYESVKDTLDYLNNIKSKGYEYINVDGQHRTDCYTRYLSNQFVIKQSVVNEIQTDKGIFVEDLKDKKFKELRKETQDEVLSTPLTLVVVNSGTLNDLVDITIYTNIGEPWNKHEMRVIIPSQFNRSLHEFMANNPLLTAMFKHTKKLDGDYSLVKKGDSLIICEWFAYHYNVKQNNIYLWPKETTLNKLCSIEGLDNFTKARFTEAKSLISSTIELINNGGSIKHERSFLDNAFIFMNILQNANHPLNPIGKKININDYHKFYDWFAKMEAKLRLEDFYVMVKGKVVIEPITGKKMTNSESFKRKCSAKKVDDIKLRSEKMITKFSESYDTLFAEGTITPIDTKNYTKQDKLEVAIATDFIDADGKPFTFEDLMGSNSIIEGDHKTARAKGNETSKANLVLRNKTANIRKSDKTIAGK
jgi:hypothetical protein